MASVENISAVEKDSSDGAILGVLGVRFRGSIGKSLGFYLQATNGTVLSGDRDLALKKIRKLRENVKFADLNSDFDFTESHIAYNYDFFSASIGRETRLVGANLTGGFFLSDNAPPIDAVKLSANFEGFKYSYLHGELIASEFASVKAGFNSFFPAKYIASHKFTITPTWGEISFWESVVYSKRYYDLAYLNPLSFFKSLEHALRDRDNSLMGGSVIFRPFSNVQLYANFILDDIKFEEIGKGYWSNKTASDWAILWASPFDFDLGLEYSRVEPYTFSHFDSLNAYVNDGFLLGTNLPPNSEESSLVFRYWTGSPYPLILKLSYRKRGENVYDENGTLIKNVGGDPLQTRRPQDSERVKFLDGVLKKTFSIQASYRFEIARNFNVFAIYRGEKTTGESSFGHFFRIGLAFENF